jgi:HEAT repeat protein
MFSEGKATADPRTSIKKRVTRAAVWTTIVAVVYLLYRACLRAIALALLFECGIRPVGLLVGGLASGEFDRSISISCLARIGEDAIPALLEALQSKDPAMREGAAWGLGSMANWQAEPGRRDPRPRLKSVAVEPLLNSVTDDAAAVRVQAAIALWKIDGQTVLCVRVLLESWNDKDPHVRSQAFNGIEHMGSEAIPVLKEASRDPDPVVRKAAVEALGDLNR